MTEPMTMKDLGRRVRPLFKAAGFRSNGLRFTKETAFGLAFVGMTKAFVPEFVGANAYTLSCEITYGYRSNAQRDHQVERTGHDGFSLLQSLFFYGLSVPRREFPGWTHASFPYRWPLEYQPADHLWSVLENRLAAVVADVESWDSPAVLRRIVTEQKSRRHAFLYPMGNRPDLALAFALVDAGDRSRSDEWLPSVRDDHRDWFERRLAQPPSA